ncbi:MAG: putative Ig domain-containing protein [Cellulomonadaceae bacterium]|nr:putative Ig domain-containing protein [Cellulomonadaceae bacterium]
MFSTLCHPVLALSRPLLALSLALAPASLGAPAFFPSAPELGQMHASPLRTSLIVDPLGTQESARGARITPVLVTFTSADLVTPDVTVTGLPPGITYAQDRSELQGTPTTTGDFTVTISARAGSLTATPMQFTWRIYQVPRPQGSAPGGATGEKYRFAPTAPGAFPAARWEIAKGTLPDGLRLNQRTGEITGKPTEHGTTEVTVRARNAHGHGDLNVSIVVGGKAEFANPFPVGTVGAPYSHAVIAGGYPLPALAIISGELPDGLGLDGTRIVGTPTRSGKYAFTIEASNAFGRVKNPGFIEVDVDPIPASIAGEPPDGARGIAYSYAFEVDGNAPVTVELASGTLPPGLTVTPEGVLQGTPTTAGTYKFTLRATDDDADTATVEAAMNIVTADPSVLPHVPTVLVSEASVDAGMPVDIYVMAFSPQEKSVEVVVKSASGEVLAKYPSHVISAGAFTMEFTVPRTAKPGTYTITVTGNLKNNVASATLNVTATTLAVTGPSEVDEGDVAAPVSAEPPPTSVLSRTPLWPLPLGAALVALAVWFVWYLRSEDAPHWAKVV